MNINIELGGPLADAINNLAAALVSAKQADVVIEKASEKAAGKRGRKPAEPESQPPEVQTEPVAPEATTTAEPETPSAPTRDDAKKAVLRVAKDKGHDAAAALLKKFGATKISEVKDEDIPAIIKDAEAL